MAGTSNKGFAEAFGEKKNALDHLQKDLANILPSMPGMPVAKFYDISIGIDFHPTVAPPSFGVPVPVPHIGMIFDIMAFVMAAVFPKPPTKDTNTDAGDDSKATDSGGEEGEYVDPDDNPVPPPEPPPASLSLMDLAQGMAPSVEVHGRWIGQAGISIQHLPGIILHALPTVPPMASSEMWMGSSTVLADGGPCTTQFHPALSCNIVGFPSILRKLKPPKPKVSLMAPTAMLTTIISFGKPVLVGGPPTIDLFQLGLKLGLKGLGKLGKAGGRFARKQANKIKAFNRAGRKFQVFIKRGVKNPKLKKILQFVKCRVFGEPVDAASGRVYHTNVDFELPGPIPLVWERTYYSDAEMDGPLGYNWHHGYNMGIYDMGDETFTLRLPDGRETALPYLDIGESGYYDRMEQLAWYRDKNGYHLEDGNGLLYFFEGPKNKEGYRMLSRMATKAGFEILFKYNREGSLLQITDSRNQKIFVDTDEEGRITCIYMISDEERTDLVRYRYDGNGNMVETLDALDVSKYFEYKGHLLTKLTNQSGLSFYWEYQGKGDDSKCIHTWGDGGILEYRFEYGNGVTRTVNSLGHKEEYYYDENKLIYKIVDANGGVTRQVYNGYQELEIVVNPQGFSTKTSFNEYGKPVSITDENGNSTGYRYDDRRRLTGVASPGGASLSMEYDKEDRLVKRTDPEGETFEYTYEGPNLKTVSDNRGNNINLQYNDWNDLVELTYSNGLHRTWEYDEAGRLISSRDVNGNYTHYGYDKADNLIRLEEPDGNVHFFEYNASGDMIKAKDKLHEVLFAYGPMGILKSRTQNERTVSFGYDRELQLRTIRNEEGEKYEFRLDGSGRVVKETGFV